jgi:hypothetical protein
MNTSATTPLRNRRSPGCLPASENGGRYHASQPQGCSPVLGVSALVPSELLGLLTDDGEDALIAGRFRDGGEYAVECLSDD